jgi:sn-glycerol 3-phosphate transport system permease protein
VAAESQPLQIRRELSVRIPAGRRARRLSSLPRYAYFAPFAVVFGLFLFLPLAAVVVLSVFDWNLISPNAKFVGLSNYISIITSPDFGALLLNTLFYVILGFLGNCVIPVLLAVLSMNVGPRAAGLYRSVLFLPAVIATSVGAVIWQYMLLPIGGPVNDGLGLLGITGPNWLSDSATVIPAIAIVASWNTFGFNFVIALGGLTAVPRPVLEAARLDGASGLKLLFGITLPMASPTLTFVAVISVLQALPHAFVPIQVMTGGGPDGASTNLFYDVYRQSFQFFQVGQGAAGSVILVALLAVAGIIQFRITEKRATYDLHD